MTLEKVDSQEYYLGTTRIQVTDSGPRSSIVLENGNLVVTVNGSKFENNETALNFALKIAINEQSKLDFIKQEPETNIRLLNQNKDLPEILKLKFLRAKRSQIIQVSQSALQPDYQKSSIQKGFIATYQYYALYGQLPEDCPHAIRDLFASLPKSRNGKNPIDELISDRYSIETEQRIINLIKEAEKKAKELDRSSSDHFEYKPQVGPPNQEQEPLDPESIETKVTDFYGGYYRGYACQFNPDHQKIEQLQSDLELYETPEPEDQDTEDTSKTYFYETVFDPTKDNNLEIPYGSIPDTNSLTSGYSIYQATNGTFYLKPNKTNQSKDQRQKQPVSFNFKIKKNQPLTDTPENEPEIWGDLDQETEQFLEQLESDHSLGVNGKAQVIKKYVRTKFKYPADEESRNQMNELYLNSGQAALHAICQHKITDCYWSNIFAGQLLARVGSVSRVIAGHYIQKDPRFDFAAVAGIGHAWSEYFDGQQWARLDATPPKEQEDEQEEQDQDEEQQDGDFGEPDTSQEDEKEDNPTLTQEQINELINQTLQDIKDTPPPPTPEQIFEQEKGVSYAKWQQVERFIRQVNAMPVPANQSITGKPSNIEQEWKHLFDLIYEKRKLPTEVYRGPVLQSEGEYLDDPVTAYIDIVSGESDPSGYKKVTVRHKTQVFTRQFEDDAILDLTSSMQGTPMQEQRKMLLSGLYNLMVLNRKLALSKYASKLKTPLHLRSTVSVFKGESLVKPLQDANQDIDEKTLCQIFDELEQLEYGGGNLAGALRAYELALTEKHLSQIKAGKLTKVLTVVTDGQIADQTGALATVQRLRAKGIIVNGLGFGNDADQIQIVCHNPEDPEATRVLTDVTEAVYTRHQMLTRALKKV
jgi:hypothetical protein